VFHMDAKEALCREPLNDVHRIFFETSGSHTHPSPETYTKLNLPELEREEKAFAAARG